MRQFWPRVKPCSAIAPGGGDYSGISVTKQTGSYPVQAYRFINLHDWGRFYADRTFDPFEAHGYFDQAIASRPGLFPPSRRSIRPKVRSSTAMP